MTRAVPLTSVSINPTNFEQVRYWAEDLKVEPEVIRMAIRSVGPRLPDVRRYLGKSAQIVFLENRLAERQQPVRWSMFPSLVGKREE